MIATRNMHSSSLLARAAQAVVRGGGVAGVILALITLGWLSAAAAPGAKPLDEQTGGAAKDGASKNGARKDGFQLEWQVVFKLINLTTHANSGELGFLGEDNDTRERNEQSLRVQLKGRFNKGLSYRFDYRNVKQNGDPALSSEQPSDIDLYRRKPWRHYIESPASPSTQTVQWYQEIDHAWLGFRVGAVDAVLGRQAISWGEGRVWKPTDLFASFSPLALDTEFRPGVDAALLRASLSDFSELSLAYVFSRGPTGAISNSALPNGAVSDSAVLHLRTQRGAETEITLVAGTLREEPLLGGSITSTWGGTGWRLESLAFQPRDTDTTETFSIMGVDYQLKSGMVLVGELYRHSQGAGNEADLRRVPTTLTFAEGRLPQLSRTVLALAASDDFAGLWNIGYSVFGASLGDHTGARRLSLLHRLRLTYSVGENAQATLALTTATGRGLAGDGTLRSEYGHLPDSLYVSIQIVF